MRPSEGSRIRAGPWKAVTQLILKRGSASRSSGDWRDDDYDVLEDGVVVGRIFKVPVAPSDRAWSGRAATTATSAARRTATSPRAIYILTADPRAALRDRARATIGAFIGVSLGLGPRDLELVLTRGVDAFLDRGPR